MTTPSSVGGEQLGLAESGNLPGKTSVSNRYQYLTALNPGSLGPGTPTAIIDCHLPPRGLDAALVGHSGAEMWGNHR
jgi:hypothetical protein